MATELPKSADKAVEKVVERLEIAEKRQRSDFKRFDRYYKLFRNYIPKGKWAWRSKVFVPYVYSTVITILSKMVANSPVINFVAREDGDDKKAKLNSQLFSYQWEKVKGFLKLVDWVLVALLFGKGIIKVYWRYEKKRMKTREFSFGGLRKKIVEKTVILFDGPDFEVLDPLDTFIDPQAKTVQEAAWIIHRTYPTIEELKGTLDADGEPLYDLPSDEEIENSSVDPYDSQGTTNWKQSRARTTGAFTNAKDDTVSRPELLEHWTDNECFYVLNRKFEIRRTDNQFWHSEKPFIELTDTPNPFDFFKMGVVEPIEQVQHALNDLVNQRLDNINIILNRMWKVGKNADVDEHELVSRPGGIIHANDITQVEAVVTPDVTQSSYAEETNLKADIQQATGVSDLYAKGVGGDTVVNRTAGGARLIVEESNVRIKFRMKFLDAALSDLGHMWHALNEQFIDSDLVIRIIGPKGHEYVKMTPQDVIGDFDVIPVSGSTEPINKEAQTAQYLNWFQQIVQTFPIWGTAVKIDWNQVLRKLSEKMGVSELDSVFPDSAPEVAGNPQAIGSLPAVQPGQMPGPMPTAPGVPGEQKPDSPIKVSVQANTPAGIEVLKNMGAIDEQQAALLHNAVTTPTIAENQHRQVMEEAKMGMDMEDRQMKQKAGLLTTVMGAFKRPSPKPSV